MSESATPPTDNPITGAAEDLLGRALVAQDFARTVRELDVTNGVTVGVLGAWGSGKTSFVNLVKEHLRAAPALVVVDFNPWQFSGTSQLTEVFFREIAAELRVTDETRFEAIANGLNTYGDVLSPMALLPFIGGWWDRTFRATKTWAAWQAARQRGSRSLRQTVTSALAKLEQPVVVVIDDIDRLNTEEIRDIFKLVRLTASFPNVVYLLAFDRTRVEQALDEDGVSGRAYLEKIMQLSFDLPAIPQELLRAQVFERLNEVLAEVQDLRFDQHAWADVYMEVIEPLIKNLRDATRLALSARSTVRALGGAVETVDVIALESLRVFRPEIFTEVQASRVALTELHDSFGRADVSREQAQIDHLLAVAGPDADLVKQLIRRLFPAATRYIENNHYGRDFRDVWKRGHRVAHLSFLDLYLSRTAPSDLIAFSQAERAYALMTDAAAFSAWLDSLPGATLEDTISGLETYQDQYSLDAVVPASVVLLNRIYRIPDRPRGMFDFMRPDIVVGRVVLRLLLRIDDVERREAAVREILSQLESYSTREDFIRSVGYRQGAGHKLVSEEVAADIEAEFARQVMEIQHSPVVHAEWNLTRVYWQAAETLKDDYVAPVFENPDEIRALLTSAQSTSRRQSLDSRSIREEPRLWWDGLVQVFGGEEALASAIARLRARDGSSDLVELGERYIGGWRPSDDDF